MIDTEKVDSSLVNMYRKLPPEVAERLQSKYEADRSAFIKWLESRIPSKEPKYWAKSSCTKCHGRGILGTLTTPSGEKVVPACSCTEKRYRAWMIEQRKLFNVQKEQGHETTAADRSEDTTQALTHHGEASNSTDGSGTTRAD